MLTLGNGEYTPDDGEDAEQQVFGSGKDIGNSCFCTYALIYWVEAEVRDHPNVRCRTKTSEYWAILVLLGAQ